MNIQKLIKNTIMEYFIITTAVTLATAILGTIFEPDELFGYYAFYSPLMIGAIACIPQLVFYSKKELTLKQMFHRKIIHFVVLETLLVVFGLLVGLLDKNLIRLLSFMLSILLIYLFVNLVSWFHDTKTANAINEGLKKFK